MKSIVNYDDIAISNTTQVIVLSVVKTLDGDLAIECIDINNKIKFYFKALKQDKYLSKTGDFDFSILEKMPAKNHNQDEYLCCLSVKTFVTKMVVMEYRECSSAKEISFNKLKITNQFDDLYDYIDEEYNLLELEGQIGVSVNDALNDLDEIVKAIVPEPDFIDDVIDTQKIKTDVTY